MITRWRAGQFTPRAGTAVAVALNDRTQSCNTEEPRASARAALRFETCRRIVHAHIAVLAMAVGPARGDTVAAAGRPLAVDVQIVELRSGQLHYRLPGGRVIAQPIDQIDYLQIDDWRVFNLAEKQHRDGQSRQAAFAFERVLADLAAGPPAHDPAALDSRRLDRTLLALCRALRAHDAEGRFDKAVATYLQILESAPDAPAYLEPMRPRQLPTAGSRFVRDTAPLVLGAIERHHQDEIGASLSKWLESWPALPPGDSSASRLPWGPRPEEAPDLKKLRAALAEARQLAEAARFDEALQRLEPLQNESAGLLRADIYYWQARALLGLAGDRDSPEADRDRRRAGLALMRVVVHFPRHPQVPECLYRAGEVCQRSGQTESAVRLWTELVGRYPRAAPWAQYAREALNRPRGPSSAPAS